MEDRAFIEIVNMIGPPAVFSSLLYLQGRIRWLKTGGERVSGGDPRLAMYPFFALRDCIFMQVCLIVTLPMVWGYVEEWENQNAVFRLAIDQFNLNILALNVLFYAVFLVRKTCRVFSGMEALIGWVLRVSGVEEILIYIKQKDTWTIKKRYRSIYKFLFVLTAGSVFYLTTYISKISEVDPQSLVWRNFFPLSWMIVLNEFRLAVKLELRTLEKKRTKPEPQPEPARISLEELKRQMENKYADLVKRTELWQPQETSSTYRGALETGEESAEEELIKSYFSFRKLEITPEIRDRIPTIAQSLRHESVVYATTEYQRLGNAVILPVWRELLKNSKVLVLCRAQEETEAMNWFQGELDALSGIPGLWKCDRLAEVQKELQVGFLSMKDFEGVQLSDLENFLALVSTVVFLDPAAFIARGCRSLSFLVSLLRPEAVNYIICGSYKNSVIDSLSQLLKTDIGKTKTFTARAREGLICYWDAEQRNGGLAQGLPESVGIELMAAVETLKAQADRVYWYGEELLPYKDIAETAESSRLKLMSLLSLDGGGAVFSNLFRFQDSGQVRKSHAMLVEDKYFHVYETARLAAANGEEQAVVHVFSPDYLLRDFLYDNFQALHDAPGKIPQYMPLYEDTKRNRLLPLVRRMMKDYVSEQEIGRKLELAADSMEDVPGEFLRQMEDYLGMKGLVLDKQERSELRRTTNTFEKVRYYRFSKESQAPNSLWGIEKIVYSGTDPMRQQPIDSSCENYVQQNFMPGQLVTIEGQYYQVDRIYNDAWAQVIAVKRAMSAFRGRRYYRQQRQFSLVGESGAAPLENVSHYFSDQIFCALPSADMRARTIGYVESNFLGNLADSSYRVLEPPMVRYYKKKQYIFIGFTEEIRKELLVLLALLFHELFYTLFPESYFYLSAGVEESLLADDMDKKILSQVTDGESNGFYIFEDCQDDIGLLQAIVRNLDTIMKLALAYLNWECGKSGGRVYLDYGDPNRNRRSLMEELAECLRERNVTPLEW